MSSRALIPFVDRFSATTVLCAGDVVLDHFVYGEASRISPEAPVPVVRVGQEQSMLGAAGNVVRNLSSLGAKINFVSVVGADLPGDRILSLLDSVPGCAAHVLREEGRRTSVKTRYLSHGQQLLRVDAESTHGIEPATSQALLRHFEQALPSCDVVVLSDYAKGVLSGERAAVFLAAAAAAGKPVMVDPKGRDFRRYQGATLVKPNLVELADASGMPVSTDAEVESAARRLLESARLRAVLVTRGPLGMMLVPGDGPVLSFRSVAREVFDVSGAGDTVVATLAVGFGSGMRLEDAIRLANVAAGLVVAKLGTATVTQEQLLAELERNDSTAADTKLVTRADALLRARLWRRLGMRIAFASGGFPTLQPAHIASFQRAREGGGRLVVGLLHGPGAAAHDLDTRSLMLAALMHVDLIVPLDESEVESLVAELRPDLLLGPDCQAPWLP